MHTRLRSLVFLAGLLHNVVTASPVGADKGAQIVLQAQTQPQQDRIHQHVYDPEESWLASEGPSVAPRPKQGTRKLQGRFLHITDLHPDEFYKAYSDTGDSAACHWGEGPAGVYGAETADCDAPHSLINATFDWIEENLKDQIDFVIWTGDSARHDSDEKIPRSVSQVLGSNRWIASKFENTFAAEDGGGGLSIPVVPTLGNNDILPHNILLPGPNRWLQDYYDVWRSFIPEEQRHAFEFGGWFSVEVVPDRLAVLSLNTLYFFDRNAGVDDCAKPSEPGFKQMEWLRVQLQFLRERGMKAILMGHVPPARTDSKTLWDETCWQKYTIWLQQYRDVVVGGLYGHMNIDHFLLHDTKDIDLSLLVGDGEDEAGEEKGRARNAMEDELTLQSKADYLLELRNGWSRLPGSILSDKDAEADGVETDPKKNKEKERKNKLGGPWAERYQLTMIGPSVVPSYFPTLRVIEYNISSVEDALVWADAVDRAPPRSDLDNQELLDELDWRSDEANKKKKKKKKDKDKDKKPKDRDLVIPDPPPKSAPPGPAYSPQPMTFTGYTQYFANLTRINNERRAGGDAQRDAAKSVPPPEFKYEVEYSTSADTLYKLNDLTVSSFVELAYRMGEKTGKSSQGASDSDGPDEDAGNAPEDEVRGAGSGQDSDDEASDDEEGTFEEAGGGKKKKKKKKRQNEVWLRFLEHAFVGTLDEEALKDYR